MSEPLALPGAICETALPLQVAGLSALRADSQCGDHPRQFAGCTAGLQGPSTHFALDLRAATGATPISIAIDADFSFEAALERGPCGDSVLEACAKPLQTDQRSRVLSVTLSPAYYELVVTGSGESDRGPVQVAAAIDPASCSAAPRNDECAAGLALDTSLITQTVMGNAACGNVSSTTRCGLESVGDVFYDLDLSSRTAPTMLELDVSQLDPAGFDEFTAALYAATDSGCGEFSMCGSNFASRLLPGRYRIGVSQEYHERSVEALPDSRSRPAPVVPAPFALRVRLRDADCAATTNDTWQAAIELDPNAETQLLAGNTACGNDDFSAACNADHGAPDLFYRLDLRTQSAPRTIDFYGTSASDLMVYLLLPDAVGVPSRVAGCQPLGGSYRLAPRLYYLVIDGRVANAGRFQVELKHYVRHPAPSTTCVDDDLLRCLDDSEPACADSRTNPECLRTALECGLDPAVNAAFCASFAGCCDGTADPAECGDAWSTNVRCR